MKNQIIVITLPFKSIPAGAFIRSHNILPWLKQYAEEKRYEILPYIPASGIINILRSESTAHHRKKDVSSIIEKDLMEINRKLNSHVLDHFIEEIYPSITTIAEKLLLKKSRAPWSSLAIDNYYILEKTMTLIERPVIGFYRQIARPHGIQMIYSMHENIEALISLKILSSIYSSDLAVMLQSPPYEFVPRISVTRPVRDLNTLVFIWRTRRLLHDIAGTRKLRLILGISPVSFMHNDVPRIARKYNVKIGVPIPSNAYPRETVKYRRTRGKEKIAVYFGRLSHEKGALDLLRVWSLVEKSVPDAELHIYGRFQNKSLMTRFYGLWSRLGLRNVYYRGYLPSGSSKLYRGIAASRVLVYPSYRDTFSMTVLEALALGVSVVAYNIPAIRFLYRRLDPVDLVEPGDVDNMASGVIRYLEMDDETYDRIHNTRRQKTFLSIYGSWRNAALNEWKYLEQILMHRGG